MAERYACHEDCGSSTLPAFHQSTKPIDSLRAGGGALLLSARLELIFLQRCFCPLRVCFAVGWLHSAGHQVS